MTSLECAQKASAESVGAAPTCVAEVSLVPSSLQGGTATPLSKESTCVAESSGVAFQESASFGVSDAHRVRLAEVAAMDASAAANCAETEASLRRTTQEAHRALQTSHAITARLSAQGETLSAVEEVQRVNDAEWRTGRQEMRRTRHWYAALGHWLRCGGPATFRGVASKGEGKALTSDAPMRQASLSSGHGGTSSAWMKTTSKEEPVQDDGAAPRSVSQQDSSSFGEAANAAEDAATPRSPATARAARLHRLLPREARGQRTAPQHRADVELCERIEPGVMEVRQLVKEMHEQALLHNEMLTTHIDRLDGMNAQAEKTIAKNVAVLQRH